MKFTKKHRASIAFELGWESGRASHRERILMPKADLWRDVVPPDLEKKLTGAEAGSVFDFTYAPGTAVPPRRDEDVMAVRRRDIRLAPPLRGQGLRSGRFYPRGILAGSGRFFSDDVRPFRVVGPDGDWVVVDTGHPLAPFPLTLRTEIIRVLAPGTMLGGSCSSWLETVTDNGPGMEGRRQDMPTDFSEDDGRRREREEDDALFYAEPRIVGHIDSLASSFLHDEYSRRIPDGGRVLDLMGSVQSHLPEGRGLAVTGLGLNAAELEVNPLLEARVVHDLNRSPELPFAEGSFDAVVCSLSWEYLTRPEEVLASAARTLVPGGVLLIGFSNRWFPPKVTRLWTHLHEFERVGLVLEQIGRNGSFRNLETLSVRGWPRPADDRHFGRLRTSDPVYVVSAVKSP